MTRSYSAKLVHLFNHAAAQLTRAYRTVSLLFLRIRCYSWELWTYVLCCAILVEFAEHSSHCVALIDPSPYPALSDEVVFSILSSHLDPFTLYTQEYTPLPMFFFE